MGVQSDVKKMMGKFKQEEKGIDENKFKVNSVKKRAISSQVKFIADRPKGYPATAKAFKKEFKKDMPKETSLSEKERKWLTDWVKKRQILARLFFTARARLLMSVCPA
ncbi:hypothetical protein [Tateyamaria sp. Alg231-49]|uniref:hypothetical protein n=1 Tax=Tateyamaria sp. Alg231-49 TaxID=1922219 RepID=UPI000D55C978|nr:hypothetical protein [Tateyamaria sp. Alg231-49]